MAKKPVLTDLTSNFGAQNTINNNNSKIEEAFDNTISRDGSTPNQMEADLDLNSNNILNVLRLDTDSLYLNGSRLISASSLLSWKGVWATATSYVEDDLVQKDGSTYICTSSHTSGTFSTDLASAYWSLFAQKGSAGAGTGDMLAANNLSDLSNADTSLANLGGGTKGIAVFKGVTEGDVRTALSLQPGVDIQTYDSVLADLSGLSLTQGDLLYYDGGNLVRLAKGSTGQILSMNPGATAPEWSSISAGATRGTALATTSGTTKDFTSIPSGVKRVTIMLDEVSLSSNGHLLVQIGDSGGVETTGYQSESVSAGVGTNSTSGFIIYDGVASREVSGVMELLNISGNVWVASGTAGLGSSSYACYFGGNKTLSNTLDRVRLTRTGTDTFDKGQVNILYE